MSLTAVQSFSTKVFFVLLYLFTPLVANNTLPTAINQTIESKKLYQNKQWKRLLHYRDGRSEIDDPTFFFSISGKTDLESELKATITALINDKSDDENSTLCRYPSRSHWILEKLPKLQTIIQTPQCSKLKKEINRLEAKQVTLILASAHINSPASAFGHTFLRIDSDTETPLLSYAVNYAAQTKEDNGFIYAYQGLFGGYEGRYSLQTYAKKLKTYSDLEQRDVWEYPLELTPEEIHNMLLHIFEIRHFYADYFFLTENCSYNLLWLIEVAKEDVELTSKFNLKAIPIDTLRAIVESGLVKKTIFRPSKRKKMLQLSKTIEHTPKAISFSASRDYNLSQLSQLTKTQKAKALELATHQLQIRHSNGEIEQKAYLTTFLQLLKERSKLGIVESQPIKQPTLPRYGHQSTKATFTYGKNERLARLKVAYHDIYDNESGYISGAYIDFLDTAISYKNQQLTLEEINLLNIRSYAIQDAIFKPISWQVSTGGKRIFNNELNAYLQAGGGVTLGHNRLFTYATLTPTLYYREEEKESLAANLGLIYNPSSLFKFGVLGTQEWFKSDEKIQTFEPFMTYTLTRESAFNIKYNHKKLEKKIEEDIMLSWFWYF